MINSFSHSQKKKKKKKTHLVYPWRHLLLDAWLQPNALSAPFFFFFGIIVTAYHFVCYQP